jgi:hypothetical protein
MTLFTHSDRLAWFVGQSSASSTIFMTKMADVSHKKAEKSLTSPSGRARP